MPGTAAITAGSMQHDPRLCMFCQEPLTDMSVPANLAFLDHLKGRQDCQEGFATWTHNMQDDFLGD